MNTIESLCQQLQQTCSSSVAQNFIRELLPYPDIIVHLSPLFLKWFDYDWKLKSLIAAAFYKTTLYAESYILYDELMEKMPSLTDQQMRGISTNKSALIPHLRTYYKVPKRVKLGNGPITITMTTCKRIELFERTVNSFVANCSDLHLVERWICVDDNSSTEDRERMKTLYPFIEFIFKTPEQKGHPESMNIIRDQVKTPYFFHIEDDWEFFYHSNWLTKCLDVVNDNPTIGQCCINKNYAETEQDVRIEGGLLFRTSRGMPYYIHDMTAKTTISCAYWPHYSLRPSLTRTEVLHKLGKYSTSTGHFEMEYAKRYVQAGYITAFLKDVYCIHTGRLTSERHDKTKLNAYDLNHTLQFRGSNDIYVINLDRRPDRWETFTKQKTTGLNVKRFSAVDGSTLKPNEQLLRIFNENDYDWNVGALGCALSHFQLYIQLLHDDKAKEYTILEDDAKLRDGFGYRLGKLLPIFRKKEIDLMYLGHYPRGKESTSNEILLEQHFSQDALTNSYGGTIGYVISKKGAEKLLQFIDQVGMKNAIDTMQQRAADVMSVYYCNPMLLEGECFTTNKKVDTDIQTASGLKVPSFQETFEKHLLYFKDHGIPICKDDMSWNGNSVLILFSGEHRAVKTNTVRYCIGNADIYVPYQLITPTLLKDLQPYRFKVLDGTKLRYGIKVEVQE